MKWLFGLLLFLLAPPLFLLGCCVAALLGGFKERPGKGIRR